MVIQTEIISDNNSVKGQVNAFLRKNKITKDNLIDIKYNSFFDNRLTTRIDSAMIIYEVNDNPLQSKIEETEDGFTIKGDPSKASNAYEGKILHG